MGLQTSGPISIGDINVELGRSRTSANTSLYNAEIGTYATIRSTANPKPNGMSPNSISEWRGYAHTATYYGYNLTAFNSSSGFSSLDLAINDATWQLHETLYSSYNDDINPPTQGPVLNSFLYTNTGLSTVFVGNNLFYQYYNSWNGLGYLAILQLSASGQILSINLINGGQPRNLTSTSITTTSVVLNWQQPICLIAGLSNACYELTDFDGYKIYQDNVLIATISGVFTYTVTGLSSSTSYVFTVKAYGTGALSIASNTTSITTLSSITYTFYESYQDSPCGSLRDLYRRDDNNEFYYFDGSSYVTANALFWYQFFDYNSGTGEYIYNKYLVSYSTILYEGTENSYCPPS